MNELEAALIEVAAALEACDVAYVLIGGLAVSLTGEPRATLDVDICAWADPAGFEAAIACLASQLRPTRQDYLEIVKRHRVLPVLAANGTRVDIVLAALSIEREMIERGVPRRVGSRTIRVATVEDLIFMKLISVRAKDLADAKALIHRFKEELDRNYLVPKLEEMADGLGRPEILEIFLRESQDES